MIWDFRIVRREINGTSIYQVHRIFYSDSSKRNMICIENIPATIIGTSAKVMLQDIETMVDAFEQPTVYIPEWNAG